MVSEGFWYGEKALPQRFVVSGRAVAKGMAQGEDRCCLGIEDEAVGVQLLLGIAAEGQVRP